MYLLRSVLEADCSGEKEFRKHHKSHFYVLVKMFVIIHHLYLNKLFHFYFSHLNKVKRYC